MTLAKRAETARASLFVRYDELNSLWTAAEEQLTKLHIPCAVRYCYLQYPEDSYRPDEGYIEECLGLQKIKGKWRICHTVSAWNDPEYYWTPITECSAETRVQAAKHLAGLRQAIVESAEGFIPKVDEAIDVLKAEVSNHTENVIADLFGEAK